MQQMITVTGARNRLGQIVSSVAKSKQGVIIVRDSIPEVVLIPYTEYVSSEAKKDKLWKARFERLLKTGKQTFRKWAQKNNVDIKKLTESDMYELVKKA